MNSIRQLLAPLAASVIILSLNSCGTVSAMNEKDEPLGFAMPILSSDRMTSTQAYQPSEILPPPGRPQNSMTGVPGGTTDQTTDTVTLTIYTADSGCETLIPAQVQIPRTEMLEATVRTVLQQQNMTDLQLMYRVQVEPQEKAVTVDFRIPPQFNRSIHSLSLCEQLAVFGSLRQTLLNNSQLSVNQVYFTNRGEEIVF